MNLNKDEYALTVRVNEKSNNKFQFVYAGLRYNTLFALYAKLDYCKNRDEIKDITFRCENYSGPVNIFINRILKAPEENKFLFIARAGKGHREFKVNCNISMSNSECSFEIDQTLLPVSFDNSGNYGGMDTEIFDSEFFYRNSPISDNWFNYEDDAEKFLKFKLGGKKINETLLEMIDSPIRAKIIGEFCIRSYGTFIKV